MGDTVVTYDKDTKRKQFTTDAPVDDRFLRTVVTYDKDTKRKQFTTGGRAGHRTPSLL